MYRYATGGAIFIAAILASAVAAEAQGIENVPIGPTKVVTSQVTSTYSSTVTTTGSFYLRLKVYHVGIVKHNTTTYVSTIGVVPFSKLVEGMNTWGLQAGQQLNYWTKAWLSSDSSISDTDDWWVPVETTYLHSDRDRDRFRPETVWA